MIAMRYWITGLGIDVLGLTCLRIRNNNSIANRERFVSWIFQGCQSIPLMTYSSCSVPCYPRFPLAYSSTTAIVRCSADIPPAWCTRSSANGFR